MEYKDIVGKEIQVEDFIIYAALWDRSATLKFGIVTQLSQRENGDPTIKVITVDRTYKGVWGLQNNGRPITLGFLDRLMVLNEIDVNEVEDILLTAYNTYKGE
jgi:hypothetical protein